MIKAKKTRGEKQKEEIWLVWGAEKQAAKRRLTKETRTGKERRDTSVDLLRLPLTLLTQHLTVSDLGPQEVLLGG